MKILTWNCRGLGSSRTVHELTKLIRIFKPQILFLIETKRKNAEMDWLRVKWDYDNCMVVDSVGRAGGLAMLWNNQSQIEVLSYSKFHIDVKVNGELMDESWRFIGFYGHFQTHKRGETWDLLRALHDQMVLPWLCAGDFNEILSDNEKQGGASRPAKQIQDFQDVVRECGFYEMQFSGSKFTWTRGTGEGLIAERLDRSFVNDDFRDRFPFSFEQHI